VRFWTSKTSCSPREVCHGFDPTLTYGKYPLVWLCTRQYVWHTNALYRNAIEVKPNLWFPIIPYLLEPWSFIHDCACSLLTFCIILAVWLNLALSHLKVQFIVFDLWWLKLCMLWYLVPRIYSGRTNQMAWFQHASCHYLSNPGGNSRIHAFKQTSLNITDGKGNEHPLFTEVNNDVSASSLSLVSPDKDKHLFSTEEINTCDSGMVVQSKEVGVELETAK